MIELYRRLLRRVRSVNELNRLQAAIDNRLTPATASQFSSRLGPAPGSDLLAYQGPLAGSKKTIGQRLFEGAEEWRASLELYPALAGKAVPEPFVRLRLRRDVFLFSNPEAKGIKRLLIVFAGRAMRPMMPVHVFLQHLDAATTDVLFFRDPTRRNFREGLFGVGSTIEDIIDQLPVLADLASYASVSTLGTSGGGVPALLAGLALGTRSATSVGGFHPESEGWEFRGQPLPEALSTLRPASGADTRVFLMCGAQTPDDQAAAQATGALVGATLLIVSSGDGKPVRHLALFPLAQQGHLAQVLEALLSTRTGEMGLGIPTVHVSDVPAATGSPLVKGS